MVFNNQFIINEDHFGYHITTIDNILNIKEKGLIPSCGERSILSGDTRNAIYFSDCFESVEYWIDRLYKNKDKKSLELLKFNLKSIEWFSQNNEISDYYLLQSIPADKIEFLRIFDENTNNVVLLDKIDYQKKLIWVPLSKY